jgi:hypothetical protein
MSKFFLTLFVCVLSISLYAQVNGNKAISDKLNAFITLSNQKKYSEAFDLMYPKMYEHVSKEELVDLMASMDREGVTLRINNPAITSFSEPFPDGSETFVRVEYTADMTIDIAEGSMYDSEKACFGMKQQFQSAYGDDNVKWDYATKRFSILVHKAMMAIQKDGGDWYLAEINLDQMDLMRALFSEAVMKTLVKLD